MKKKTLLLLWICLIVCFFAAFSSCSLFGKKTEEKAQLTADMVRKPTFDGVFIYTGEPIVLSEWAFEIFYDGRFVQRKYFEFEYKDNTNVGTATIIVKTTSDNPVLKGQVELHFTIAACPDYEYHGESVAELNAILSDPNIASVELWSHLTVEEGEKLYVPEGKGLYLSGAYTLTVYGDFENDGRVDVSSPYEYNGVKREAVIYNKGRILNHGKMEFKSGGFLNSFGLIESDSEISVGGKVCVNDEKPSFFREHDEGVVFVRVPVSERFVMISEENRTCAKGTAFYEPRVTLMGEKDENFTVEYRNNDHAGEASVIVTLREDSTAYYGTASVSFEIYRGSVSVSDFSELKTYSESGDFVRYGIMNLTIGEGETFSLKPEETLTVGDRLTVNGTLENAGTILVRKNQTVIQGVFRNAANASFTAEAGLRFEGSSASVNEGSILSKGTLTLNGCFENRESGSLESKMSCGQYGSVENAGSITLQGEAHFYASSTLRNAGGLIDMKKNSVFYDMNVVNTGKIVNGGDLVCLKLTRFENAPNGFDNENGCIWTFDPFPYVTKNVTIRKYLTDESVDFSPEYTEIFYDGTRKEPKFTVNGENIPQDEYSKSAVYLDRTDANLYLNEPGTVEVKIRIKTYYSKYAGEYLFTYVIKRATIEVSNYSELSRVLLREGYDKIYLTNDIVFPVYGNCYLRPDTALYLNGHSIVFGRTFDNYGTIVSDSPLPTDYAPSKDSAAIVILSGTTFRNFGSIRNDNFLYAEGGSIFQANAKESSAVEGGAVVNNGLIYANNELTAMGEGRAYVRKAVSDIASSFTIAESVYTGSYLFPEVDCLYGGEPMDASRFELTYSDNVNAGTGLVTVKVADEFDETLYGSVDLTFPILRAEIKVVSFGWLRAAAQNANYEKIILDAPIRVIENITLSDEQTLDLGPWALTFAQGCSLTMGKACRLIVEADSKDRFIKYVYGADEITLTADISQAVEMNFNAFDLAEIAGENNNSTVVHMNGHSLSAGITIINAKMTNFSIEFENSSDSPSAVGTEVGGYAFEVGTCSKATNVTLRNLTVYGFENSASGTDVLHITADNCSFRGSTEAENQFALRIWSQSEYVSGTFNNCVFSGASGIYLNAGCVYDHDSGTTLPSYFFDHCSISAYGEYTDFYRQHYGNALVLERINRRVAVKITESSLFSQKGNGIRMVGTVGLYLNLDSKTTIQYGSGKSDILWDSST